MSLDRVGAGLSADPVLAACLLVVGCGLATLQWALTALWPSASLTQAYAEPPRRDPRRVASTYVLPPQDHTLHRG